MQPLDEPGMPLGLGLRGGGCVGLPNLLGVVGLGGAGTTLELGGDLCPRPLLGEIEPAGGDGCITCGTKRSYARTLVGGALIQQPEAFCVLLAHAALMDV